MLAGRVLKFAKMIERQMWDFESPMRQHPNMKHEILNKLETRNFTLVKKIIFWDLWHGSSVFVCI